MISIGTAGWSIPRQVADGFPAEGAALERYAARFPVTEVNSSFHRPHRLSTWDRWRESVPADFRFSVKIPKTITHQARLQDCSELLSDFLGQAHALQVKLAVLLVQLPPKLEFDVGIARDFLADLAGKANARIACEPRHASWFTGEADALLQALQVARVAADPFICAEASAPGGWPGFQYWRLHGSPVIYRSSYADRILAFRERIESAAKPGAESWCIFDNTASSAATSDALALMEVLAQTERRQGDLT